MSELSIAKSGFGIPAKPWLSDRLTTTTVRDLDVYDLVGMARNSGLHTGVVLDCHPESNGLELAVRRLERKAEAGAQFAVTQPVYDVKTADEMAAAVQHIGIPVIMGILPLRTHRHAVFLNDKVAGIAVPQELRQRLVHAEDTVSEGVANAREMLTASRARFAGACIMPPFDHYEILFDLLS